MEIFDKDQRSFVRDVAKKRHTLRQFIKRYENSFGYAFLPFQLVGLNIDETGHVVGYYKEKFFGSDDVQTLRTTLKKKGYL